MSIELIFVSAKRQRKFVRELAPKQRFQLTPQRLIGDTAYGSAPMLAWMVEDKGIEPCEWRIRNYAVIGV